MKECDKKFKEGLDELYDEFYNDVRRYYLYFKKKESFKEKLEHYWNMKHIADHSEEYKRVQYSIFVKSIDKKEHTESDLFSFIKDIDEIISKFRAEKDFYINRLFLDSVKAIIKGIINERNIKSLGWNNACAKTKGCKASLEIGIPHIHDLRVNPSPYSLKDIAVGSIVKVSNGEERFWVTVKTIHNQNSYITGSVSNELLGDYGYDFGDVIGFYLNNILDIEPLSITYSGYNSGSNRSFAWAKSKSGWHFLKLPLDFSKEDTYKPGDRVFFIKQNLHGHEPYRMNCYLGIVKDWAVGSQGKVHCTFDSSFNVMDLETLDSDVCDSDDVNALIGSKDFSKALIACNANLTMSVYGDITLCPVDEKHFPKINSIVAKLAKPERKPFNPTGNQIFKDWGWIQK